MGIQSSSRKDANGGERKKAQELAERTGVPLWGAYRVVRSEITLNELLKSMLRREKFQKLQKQGLDADLAGHVASGSLPVWRAQILQDMRTKGRPKFTRDRIEMTARDKRPISVWRFGQEDWEVGDVLRARTYDFQFRAGEAKEPDVVFKHDVKMLCEPADVEALRGARRFEKKVLKEGLGASKERKDRYRPTDEQLCKVRDSGNAVKWVFRDGTSVVGSVAAFGRWDMGLELDNGALATLFFHALHGATDRNLEQATR